MGAKDYLTARITGHIELKILILSSLLEYAIESLGLNGGVLDKLDTVDQVDLD